MKKVAALAFVAALGFSVVAQDASAASVSSGALDLLMNSETDKNGLVQPAQSSEQVEQDEGVKVKGALQYRAPTAVPVEDWPEAPADGANVRGQATGNVPGAKEHLVSPHPIRRPTVGQHADNAGRGAALVPRRRGYVYARYHPYRHYGRGYYRRGRGYYGSVYGRICDPEILGHITRWSCAYRYR